MKVYVRTFMVISCSVLLTMRNVSEKGCRENQKKCFKFSNFFFSENRVVYEIMWKSTVQPDRPQMTIWRIRIASWLHTLRIGNSYCFSTAQRLHDTRLSVTLYALFLSCIMFNLVVLEVTTRL